MLNLLALYRGKTLGDVRTIAVTCDPKIISDFADRLIAVNTLQRKNVGEEDEALLLLNKAVEQALRIVKDELSGKGE
jgi:hypothetical protein